MDRANALDSRTLEALTQLGGAEFLTDLIALFETHGRELAIRLTIAADAGRLDDAFNAAHQLKSSAMTLGLHAVQQSATRVEEAARSGAFDDIRELVVQLSSAVSEAILLLRQYPTGGGNPAPRP